MKPIHLQVAACVVLVVPIVLICHNRNEDAVLSDRSGKGRMLAKDSGVNHTTALRRMRVAEGANKLGSSRRVSEVMNHCRSAAPMEPASDFSHADPDETVSRAIAGGDSRFQQKLRLPAVQLAANAKFPAVFMARVLSQGNSDEEANPAIKAAHEAVEGKFYQELAENSVSADAVEEGDTIVIGPGTVLEDASAHANEQFRSLFGNDAYNRHAMDSAKEVMLPAESGDSGN